MKLLFTGLLIFSSAFAQSKDKSEDYMRLPSWQQLVYEQDDDVDDDKFVLKLNLNMNAELYFHDDVEWRKHAELKQKKKNVFTLDSGRYLLMIAAPGKETVSRSIYAQGGYFMEVDVNMQSPRPTNVRKPVIYINTNESIDIALKVEPVGEFTFTYPEHGTEGWSFTANPDGTLMLADKKLDYLFWEGVQSSLQVNTEQGFCVAGNSVVSFLEEKLTHLGFNDREMQDFITFWAPIMQENPYNYVNFIVGKAYDNSIASYESSVTFDSELRVFMAIEPLNEEIKLEEQSLPTFKRSGLSLIEWGGGEINQINKSINSL